MSRDNKKGKTLRESIRNPGSSSYFGQSILNSLQDDLMIVNREYQIVEVNDILLSRVGKSREEVIGRYCYNVIHTLLDYCRTPRDECPVRKVWETGKATLTTHVHAGGFNGRKEERYVDIIASPISDTEGNVNAVVELMRDVTDSMELAKRLAKAREDLTIINKIGTVVTQSLDLDTVLGTALDKTLEMINKSTGGILLLDEEKGMLCYRVHDGLSGTFVREQCLRPGEGISGIVAESGRSILINDISTDPRATPLDMISSESIRSFTSVPLRTKGKVFGVLNIGSSEIGELTSEDMPLLESIAAQIAIAVENARLHQEIQKKEVMRGELLREVFAIQEEERKRIARELHDETSQALASLNVSLAVAESMLPPSAGTVKTRLQELSTLAVRVMEEINRLVFELRPTLLDDLGLVAATRWLVDNRLQSKGVEISFKTVGRVRRLSPQHQTTLFRVIQEAVSNITRHAHASSVDVSLHFKKTGVRVRIMDDGCGFDIEEAITCKQRPRGLGLLGMKERIDLVNGTLSIHSCHRVGTTIDMEIPTK